MTTKRKRWSELAADEYAVSHGMTFSELVADALRRLMRKKPAWRQRAAAVARRERADISRSSPCPTRTVRAYP